MDKKCNNCRFYDRNGYCSRYPPTSREGFPHVGYDCLCGEYQPTPQKKPWIIIGEIKPGEDINAPMKSFP